MADEWRDKWDKPIIYTCSSCEKIESGCLSGGGYFSEPTGPTAPLGWWKRFSKLRKEIFYACSEKCAHNIDIYKFGDEDS